MSIFQTNISLLNKFLKQFTACFSKKQMSMFILLIYALFKDYKRNSIEAMAKAIHTDYQKLQYFFSDAQWDIQTLKCKRLEIIQKQKTTASTKDGLLALDDTGCPKPYYQQTQFFCQNSYYKLSASLGYRTLFQEAERYLLL